MCIFRDSSADFFGNVKQPVPSSVTDSVNVSNISAYIPYHTVLPQIFKLLIIVVTPRIMGNCSNFPRSEKIRWDSRKNSLFMTASRHSQHVIKQPSHVRLHVFWMYLVCCDLSKHVVCRRCVNRLRFWFDIKIRNWEKWRQNIFGFESDSHSAHSFVLLLFLNSVQTK